MNIPSGPSITIFFYNLPRKENGITRANYFISLRKENSHCTIRTHVNFQAEEGSGTYINM